MFGIEIFVLSVWCFSQYTLFVYNGKCKINNIVTWTKTIWLFYLDSDKYQHVCLIIQMQVDKQGVLLF